MNQIDRHDEALAFIRRFISLSGYPPSRREIADSLGMSVSTVQILIQSLIDEGLITVSPRVSRGVVITGSNMKHQEVAL